MKTQILGTHSEAVEHPSVTSVAELIFGSRFEGDGEHEVIRGCHHPPDLRAITLTLDDVRHEVLRLVDLLEARGIRPGDTVALLRFARTNETMTALVYLALSAWGVRVLFPMYLEVDAVRGWFELSATRHVIASFAEVERDGTEHDQRLARQMLDLAGALGLPTTCFEADLGLDAVLDARMQHAHVSEAPSLTHPRVQAMLASTSLDTESLLLTTSGTSGVSKLVRYTQGGYLRSCAAWEEAGFYAPEVLGGRCLNLLLGHSMGLRALWNAVWTRVPVCLITPEWFAEHPERVGELLVSMQPEHITGGPTVFGLVLQMFETAPALATICAPHLKCLVSSGAPYDPELATMVEGALGMPLHNALGLTEAMQVASTVLGGSPPSLGQPLPGVRLRLTRDDTLPPDAWRLEIGSSFGFSGYLGRPDPGPWFDTGDLVELLDDGTVQFVGREKWDFLNDSVGVKLARARIAELYQPLPDGVEAIEFAARRDDVGLGALVFLSDEGEPGPVFDPERAESLRAFFQECNARAERERDEFERRHMEVARFLMVRGAPPRTRKGNISRARIAAELGDLLEAVRVSAADSGLEAVIETR